MDNFTNHNNLHFEEIQLSVYDSEIIYYGGSQHWFHSKNHQLSGCGPVAAANITAYLALSFPDKYSNLYPYTDKLNKSDFIEHMTEIRKFVKPGAFGLTCVQQFVDNVLSFCETKNITLTPQILCEKATMDEAVKFISTALREKLPVAILVLKHPVKELEEYTWHWMTITQLKLKTETNKYYITVSTYGECREIDLELLWNHRRPKDIIRLAYFK
jgi:hypothetical protein